MMNHILIAFLTILTYSVVNAQETTIVLKGVITDRVTAKPVGVSYEISDKQGNKVADAKSNPKTGEYSSALKPGADYTIFFYGFDILKSTKSISIQPASKYEEVSMDFTVEKLVKGMELYSVEGYDPGSTQTNVTGEKVIAEAIAMLKGNRNLHVNITLYPDMAPPRYETIAPPKQDKKKKKGNESAIPSQQKLLNPTERQTLNADLLKQRMDAILSAFPDASAQLKRMHFIVDKASDPQQDIKRSTLVISVGEVKSLFD
ncbi:MAG: hypothetical protein ACKOAK_03775 [Ignavibacteria bacterium]